MGSARGKKSRPRLRLKLPLYHPDDERHLTEVACLVRSQLEVFVESGDEEDSVDGDGDCNGVGAGSGFASASEHYDGRVGIRCVHCAPPEGVLDSDVPCGAKRGRRRREGPEGSGSGRRRRQPSDDPGGAAAAGAIAEPRPLRRARGAVARPTSIRLVYQAVRNWQRHHLPACSDVPPNVRAHYDRLRNESLLKRSTGAESSKYWEAACARIGLVDTEKGIRARRSLLEGTWMEEMGRAAAREVAEKLGLKSLELSTPTAARETASLFEPDRVFGPCDSLEPLAVASTSRISSIAASAAATDVTTPTLSSSTKSDDGTIGALGPQHAETGTVTIPSLASSNSAVCNSHLHPSASASAACAQPASGTVGTAAHSISGSHRPSSPCVPYAKTAPPPLVRFVSAPAAVCGEQQDISDLGSEFYELFADQRPSNEDDSGANGDVAPAVDFERPSTLTQQAKNPAAAAHSMTGSYRTPSPSASVVSTQQGVRKNHTPSPSMSTGSAPAKLEQVTLVRGENKTNKNTFLSDLPAIPLFPAADPTEASVNIDHGECSANNVIDNCAHLVAPSASHQSKDKLLQRVQLARGIVHAAGTIREMSPLLTSDGREWERKREDLSGLGPELYNLFSCRGSLDNDREIKEEETEEDERLSQQRPKKEKRLGKRQGRAPLRELGLPATLCGMVSSLLDDDGVYESVDEVEEDLRLMETQPDKYLFSVPSGRLQLSRRTLYGRTKEAPELLEAYARTADANATSNGMVLLSGYSGTGKSSLVESVRDELIERGAKFITGKFDAMRQMQPLSAVVSALDDYCNLLAQDTGRIGQVREDVTEALGGEGSALAELLPSLHKIIDVSNKGRASVQASGREALQRFVFHLQLLLRTTCSRSHPVVLFLDDLQWADEVSLELIRALITDSQLRGCLFIGCYRSNEVGSNPPLVAHLSDIQKSGSVDVTTLCVDDLDGDAVNDMLSDALRALPRRTRGLTEAVIRKTGGNALFVVQFLSSLRHIGLLRFSLLAREWEWDVDAIEQKEMADSVVELMTAKILRLAPHVREALRVAAGFGAQCDEGVLSIIDRGTKSAAGTAAALDIGVSEGLMAKVGTTYKFSHDQIQSAAYMLIPEWERAAFHLRIGRLLLKWSSAGEAECNLFVAVDQMHRGIDLITERSEKITFAQLCRLAGMKAFSMSSFLPASVYLKAGIGLLVSDDWDLHRDLCLDLYNLCAETEYILGHFAAMKSHLEEVLRWGRTCNEKMRAYLTIILSMGAEGRVPVAIETGLKVLVQLGESIPTSATPAEMKQEVDLTMQLLQPYTQDSLLKLRVMDDVNKREVMRILNVISCYLYFGGKELFPLVVCRMIKLTLSHGVCKESAFGFALYGFILNGRFGKLDFGYRYGKVAVALVEKLQANDFLCRVHCMVYSWINAWIEPLQSVLEPIKHAGEVGLLTGDTELAMFSISQYLILSLVSGRELGRLMDEMRVYYGQMLDYKQNLVHLLGAPYRQAVLNLLGRSADPIKLVGEEMDEETLLQNMGVGRANLRSVCCSLRMWLEYLFGEYELAAETAQSAPEVEQIHVGKFSVLCNHVFYSGLAAIAMARKEGRGKWDSSISSNMEQMKRWASSSPWNCQHKLELMNAEYAYLGGDIITATEMYECAVDTASKHRFIHEQAVALERAGMFHREQGNHAAASAFFQRACSCYSKWGASSKAQHVQATYL